MNDKKIEITLEQLAEASAKAMAGERLTDLLKNAPILALAFSVFSVELSRVLFESGEEQENE